MKYFDASYIVRLYWEDFGWQPVRAVAATDQLACSLLGHAEVVATFHRKLRETRLTQNEFRLLLRQFEEDCSAGAFDWLPLSVAAVTRLVRTYASLPRKVYLRGADAIHLASAAEAGLHEVYSNDTQFLAAAPHFGLRAVNVI